MSISTLSVRVSALALTLVGAIGGAAALSQGTGSARRPPRAIAGSSC